MTLPDECGMTLAEGAGCTAMTIDGPRSTVAVDDTWRLQMRGSSTEGGDGGGGRGLLVDAAAVGGCDKRGGGGGGWGSNGEAKIMVCAVFSNVLC